ncbi:OTU domain-containing protein 5-A-like [Macrosteles quadrilineatus]|uniref:OTU domain-containing protein 5-A-like n=1 Tax=Macrosteles quadrilineatus TaxID=74068 RepID=UPI0023E1BF95|nr:OTU domain-containing protein 5-A-like [Macrosteles quadrilineatus]XP_054280243.1 OTU domain-containing protein 5-A-like [Macrosteles quadrilineatus]
MTILSKKKAIQGKSEVESPETTTHHNGSHSHGISLGSLPSHPQINERNREERLNSPHSWPREEKRASHVQDYDSHESGPSHSKRRHRSSPHRTTRSSKLRERERASPGSSPKAGPSCDDNSGYNSGDEYDSRRLGEITEAEWVEKDRLFEKKMRKRGLIVKAMGEDGACLFRAVADQVYGDQEMHAVVRKHCMDYIAANGDYFSQYVTEDFSNYVNRKRMDCTHGNHIEMQAMSEMYNRTIEVFCYGKDPINIFHGVNKTDNEPIRLSYQRNSHYNSIVDPHKATIGVGLGLPNFSPGGAEKSLIKDAIRQSEDFHIEQAMLEDKLRATDWEATNEAIEEQVARDSYLQWLRDSEKRDKALARSSTATSTSATVTCPSPRSPRSRHNSPKHDGGECSQSFNLIESASFLNIVPPSMFGLSEWEDAGIVAQVLAASQQEYLDNLKKARDANNAQEAGTSVVDHLQPSTSS